MKKNNFSDKDYDKLLKCINNYHVNNDITASVEVCDLLIRGIVSGKLIIKMIK